MKILVPLAADFGKQGGWRVISKLPDYWLEMGHDVVFLTPDYKMPYFPTKAKIIHYDNFGEIVSKEKCEKSGRPTLGVFQTRWALEKAINKLDADVILATHSFTAGPVERSTVKAKKFYYIQAYEPEMYEFGPLWYKIYKYIATRSYSKKLIKIVNAEIYFDYKEIKANKVVYPGLDLNVFKPNLKESEKPFVLGTIGRVEEYKGTVYVLEAYKQLREIYKENIELHVAFGDKSWENIDGVKLIFPENDIQLSHYYQSLDAYLCGGIIQMGAIHYPIIESMACKVSVISTHYFPASNENAWVIPIKDVNAIKNAVEEAMQKPKLVEEKANNAFGRINEFSWTSVSKKMLDYFKDK